MDRQQLEAMEVVLPFAHGGTRSPMVTRVRSTLITASLLLIREYAWETRYYASLPAHRHDEIRSLVAGTWVSLALAVDHYTAMDGLGLTTAEIEKIGEDVGRRTQQSFLATLARASTSFGATPWVILNKSRAIWTRIFDGGDVVLYKGGPKDAYHELVQLPLFRIGYFRRAVATYWRAMAQVMASTVYVKDVAQLGTGTSVVLGTSWA